MLGYNKQNRDSVRPILLASWYWDVSETQKQMACSRILHEKNIYPETLFWLELCMSDRTNEAACDLILPGCCWEVHGLKQV